MRSHNFFDKHDTSWIIALLGGYKYIFIRSLEKILKLKEIYLFFYKIWLQCTLAFEVFWNLKASQGTALNLTFKDVIFWTFLLVWCLDSWQLKVLVLFKKNQYFEFIKYLWILNRLSNTKWFTASFIGFKCPNTVFRFRFFLLSLIYISQAVNYSIMQSKLIMYFTPYPEISGTSGESLIRIVIYLVEISCEFSLQHWKDLH